MFWLLSDSQDLLGFSAKLGEELQVPRRQTGLDVDPLHGPVIQVESMLRLTQLVLTQREKEQIMGEVFIPRRLEISAESRDCFTIATCSVLGRAQRVSVGHVV